MNLQTIKTENPNCQHFNFAANVRVNRIESSTGGPLQFSADIVVKCHDCDLPFHFIGLPYGMAFHEPRLSVDGCEMRAPIAPGELFFGDESRAGEVFTIQNLEDSIKEQ